jgi:hypothetical protein
VSTVSSVQTVFARSRPCCTSCLKKETVVNVQNKKAIRGKATKTWKWFGRQHFDENNPVPLDTLVTKESKCQFWRALVMTWILWNCVLVHTKVAWWYFYIWYCRFRVNKYFDEDRQKRIDTRSIFKMNTMSLDWFKPSHGVTALRLVFLCIMLWNLMPQMNYGLLLI